VVDAAVQGDNGKMAMLSGAGRLLWATHRAMFRELLASGARQAA
jgi:hypothetical protein